MATTYNNLYLDIRNRLKKAGCIGASLEARELVCCGSGKTKEEFFRDAPLYVTPETEQAILALVERHLNGEPVAYLIGEWEFYGLPLDVSEAVLIPRPDTEVLASQAIEFVQTQGACRVLDLCAGSGCIGLAIAANAPECRVLLGEISEPAVRICRQNIRRNSLTGQVTVMTMDALQPPPRAIGEFQCIVSNPPYIPRADIETLDHSVKNFEPYLALCGGEDGYEFYTAIIRHWKNALAIGGRMYFEV
ncbi:MAG: peptide chain release factor N(5)-glutamine methyltransferase, partial [Oscillospiraceae bacterium]|nr:peptide chain release factor N(5)-glutamine methyltransferase [Oscillospiraceae bacterium]